MHYPTNAGLERAYCKGKEVYPIIRSIACMAELSLISCRSPR